MKKTFKCGIAAAVIVAAGFAAYKSYGAYGAQDNSLLMQNIEALAQSNESGSEPGGDPSEGESGGPTKCKDENYVPNHFLYASTKTLTGTSHIKGEISVTDSSTNSTTTYYGDFEKDKTYTIIITLKNCDGIQDGACCDQRKVGTTIKKK